MALIRDTAITLAAVTAFAVGGLHLYRDREQVQVDVAPAVDSVLAFVDGHPPLAEVARKGPAPVIEPDPAPPLATDTGGVPEAEVLPTCCAGPEIAIDGGGRHVPALVSSPDPEPELSREEITEVLTNLRRLLERDDPESDDPKRNDPGPNDPNPRANAAPSP